MTTTPPTEQEIKQKQHEHMDKIIENAKSKLHEMIESAWNSGALDDHLKEDDYVLTKAIFTVWGRSDPWGSFKHHKDDVKALELIV